MADYKKGIKQTIEGVRDELKDDCFVSISDDLDWLLEELKKIPSYDYEKLERLAFKFRITCIRAVDEIELLAETTKENYLERKYGGGFIE